MPPCHACQYAEGRLLVFLRGVFRDNRIQSSPGPLLHRELCYVATRRVHSLAGFGLVLLHGVGAGTDSAGVGTGDMTAGVGLAGAAVVSERWYILTHIVSTPASMIAAIIKPTLTNAR